MRVMVVDDEPLARDTLRSLLSRHQDVELVGESANGLEAVAAIRDLAPDAVFLDVQMPGLDGFGVVEQIAGTGLPLIVFVTAYDRYALRAFDVHAVDYLLKPFEDERFEEALQALRERRRLHRYQEISERVVELLDSRDGRQRPWLARISVRVGPKVLFIRTEDIDWIEAEDYYVRIHVAGRSHLLREPLQSLEGKLDPSRFVRIHRSTIVNVERVREIHAEKADYLVVLDNGRQLRMSRSRREGLERLFSR
jgi:two-component system LytT family response regulator